jgi:hypothetical protein
MPAYDSTFWPDVRGQEYDRTPVHQTIRSPWETAGDQVDAVAGSNILYAFTLGSRTLTDAQAAAFYHAVIFCGGDTEGLYFLDWVLRSETNLIIGTGTGSGDLTLDLKCRLKSDDATAAGLTVTKNGSPVAYTLDADTGENYVQHRVIIAAANNTNGATYRASWTAARRRRKVRIDGPAEAAFFLAERTGGSSLWTMKLNLIETEAS